MRRFLSVGVLVGLACAALFVAWVWSELPEWSEMLGWRSPASRVSAETRASEGTPGPTEPRAGAEKAEKILRDFESDAVGQPPGGFEFGRTGGGAEGRWTVRIEKGGDKNHVLVQESADKTDYRFPVAVLKDGAYKDVTVTVRARPLAGEVDQGFGIVWRYKDVNNYYVTRCNADEDNCTIYHTVNSRRRAFLNQDVKVAKNTWHTLKVEARGNHFLVWYDGTKVLDARDGTFKDAGKIGLWTKADSVVEFDDLIVEAH